MSVLALTLPAFLALAPQCTPKTADGRLLVAPETLAAVAWTESKFNVLSVGINEPGARAPEFKSVDEASAWVAANAHRSIDLGVMQINSSAGHMQSRGLPLTAALDPCIAVRVGSEVLARCYRTASASDEQERVRQAASCYNAGNHRTGFVNGYVTRVQASAEIVVPAIRPASMAAQGPPPVPLGPPPATGTLFARSGTKPTDTNTASLFTSHGK